jgi:hypothetical protein
LDGSSNGITTSPDNPSAVTSEQAKKVKVKKHNVQKDCLKNQQLAYVWMKLS